MDLLEPAIRNYAWGSRTAIAELRGLPSPSAEPEAELWMGAHPSAPSRVLRDGTWQSLLGLVASRPESELGPEVTREFGASLPFLLKVLAAERPLSLQAHPSRTQAEEGFLADEARGIPRNAPERRYPDSRHKPELLCAMSEFDALCGFRPLSDTLRLLGELDVPTLGPLVAVLRNSVEADALRGGLELLLGLGPSEQTELVSAVASACERLGGGKQEFERERSWAVRLAHLYPGDAGVVVALLLNLVRLAPGEAIFLPARRLHAYLGGVGIEIMASSDNVLRGGLTPKHVDVPELLRVLAFEAEVVRPLRPQPTSSGEQLYPTPVREFRLSRLDLGSDATFSATVHGPEILLCIQGLVKAQAGDGRAAELGKGQAAFVSAATRSYKLRGQGTIFRAAVAGVEPS